MILALQSLASRVDLDFSVNTTERLSETVLPKAITTEPNAKATVSLAGP